MSTKTINISLSTDETEIIINPEQLDVLFGDIVDFVLPPAIGSSTATIYFVGDSPFSVNSFTISKAVYGSMEVIVDSDDPKLYLYIIQHDTEPTLWQAGGIAVQTEGEAAHPFPEQIKKIKKTPSNPTPPPPPS